MEAALEISNLSKTFGKTKALEKVALRVDVGEMVALIGASGSGKSTLLRHVPGLIVSDPCDSHIKVLGEIVQEQGLLTSRIRKIRSRIGFIFQQFNLVDRLPLFINVLAGMLARVPTWRSLIRFYKPMEKRMAMEALHRVGMSQFATQRSSTLSGGQQQRAAIARAMVQEAELILADEPIASLDPESSRQVMGILSQINQKDGVTVLVSLHQVDYALRYCRRIVALKGGKILYDGPSQGLTRQMLHDVYGTKLGESGICGEEMDPFHSFTPALPMDLEIKGRVMI